MRQSQIYNLETQTTDRKLFRLNSQYMVGGKMAKATAIQDIKQYCEETHQLNYLYFISMNPKYFVKKYVKMDIYFTEPLSERAMRYLSDFFERQEQNKKYLQK